MSEFKGFETVDPLPHAGVLAEAGMQFGIKYCSLGAYPHKEFTDAEIADCHAHGIACGFIWERYNDAAHFSAVAGAANAKAQTAYMANRRVPQGVAAFHAVDFDPTPAEVEAAIVPYFTAARKIVMADGYLIGAYGSVAVLRFLKELGLIHYTWRANAPGWSDYAMSVPFAFDIDQQRGNVLGLSSDPDIATNLDWAWRPGQR